jgi:hypothetical protein
MGSVEALAIFAFFAALASAARFFFAFSPMVVREYIQAYKGEEVI